MAGDRQHEVVVRRIHLLDPGAERRPERREPGDGVGIRPGRRRQYAPAAVEQGGEAGIRPAILGPGHGMGGNDCRAGQCRLQRRGDGRLGRADVADDRVGRRQSAIDAAASAMAPTGTHRMTRSASVTAAAGMSATSARSSSCARRRTFSSASKPVSLTAGRCSRVARAIEEPISPSPMMATVLKSVVTFLISRIGQNPLAWAAGLG